MAVELMETEQIKKSDLKKGKIYRSKTGKKYIFIGKIGITEILLDDDNHFIYKNINSIRNQANLVMEYSGTSFGRIIHLNSIKLVEERDFVNADLNSILWEKFGIPTQIDYFGKSFYLDKEFCKLNFIDRKGFNKICLSRNRIEFNINNKIGFLRSLYRFLESDDLVFNFDKYVESVEDNNFVIDVNEVPF